MSWVSVCLPSKRAVKEICSPVAIFQSVATVGLDSPLSICPSMLLLTPVCSAMLSRLSFFSFRICLKFSEILLLIASMCFLLGSNQPPSKVNGANACVMTHFYCYCIICICLCQSVLTVFTNKTDVIAYKNSVSFLCNLPISQEKPCRRPSMRQSYSTFSHSVFSPLLPSISKFHPESYVQPQPCSEAPAEFPPPWKSSLPHSYPCRNHCLQS